MPSWTRTRTGLELRTGLGLVHSKRVVARLFIHICKQLYIQQSYISELVQVPERSDHPLVLAGASAHHTQAMPFTSE